MRYALIGCGNISRRHMEAMIDNNLELVALCDLNINKIDKLLESFGFSNKKDIKKYTDFRLMIAENDINLVSIATESGKHAEIGIFCIENGVNVIIEKPISLSMIDAGAILNLANKNGVKVGVCHQNRFNIAIQKARRAIEQGRLGKISHGSIHIRWYRGKTYYDRGSWRGTWEQDGGALMNQCIHGIDILRWMLGDDVTEIYGVIKQQFHNYIEGEDLGLAIVKFSSGIVATIEGTTNTYPTSEEACLHVFGEKGTIKIGGTSMNNIEVWKLDDQKDEDGDAKISEKVNDVYGNSHPRLFRDMIQAINNNRQPYVDADAGKKALEIVLAIYKSQKEGIPVRLPLENFSTLDMVETFNEITWRN